MSFAPSNSLKLLIVEVRTPTGGAMSFAPSKFFFNSIVAVRTPAEAMFLTSGPLYQD